MFNVFKLRFSQNIKSTRLAMILSFFLIIIIFISFLSWQGLQRIENQIKTDLTNKLKTVLEITHRSLNLWIHHRIAFAKYWTTTQDFVQLVKEQLQVPINKYNLINSRAQKQIRKIFKSFLLDNKDLGIFVINPQNINIISMHDENIGVTNLIAARKNILKSIFDGQSRLINPMISDIPLVGSAGILKNKAPTMFIGVPIRDIDDLIIAVLLIRIDPSLAFSNIIQLANLGKTGDAYAFNKNGHLISKSRFDRQLHEIGLLKANEGSILSIKLRNPGGNITKGFHLETSNNKLPLTAMALSALKGNNGINIEGYRDYRGVPVVGTWLWDKTLNLGITYEIDIAEAYRSFFKIRQIVIFVLSLILIIFIILAIVLFVGRHRALHQAIMLDKMVYKRTMELTLSNKKLIIAKDSANRANKLKSEFLSNMSHDIRTPLNGILGFTNLLQKRNPDQKSLDYLDLISKLGIDLLSLMNNILDFSKIDTGQIEIKKESFTLFSFIEKIRIAFSTKFKEKNINFEIYIKTDIPNCIIQDEQHLYQILVNLLDNAHKYTEKGNVSLSITYDLRKDMLELTVKDTGIGIEKKNIELIFQPFTQINIGIEPEKRGTGLGLPICHKLVNLIGGSISIKSKINDGSEFSVYIPANSKFSSKSVKLIPISTFDSNNKYCKLKKILIIDENIVNREILSEQLQTIEPFALLFAEDDIQASTVYIEHKPDLVFLNHHIPYAGCIQTIRRLKERGYKNPIIVLLAGNFLDNERQSCLKAGADAYIIKPIDIKILEATLGKYLNLT